MKGIIVLDGPDACGKTTFAEAIKKRCEQLNIPYLYIHSTYRFKDKMFLYHEAVVRRAIKHSQKGIVVIDRLHWSEYVYGKVFRGGSRWPLQWRYFDRLLQKHCAMNVICCGQSPEEVVNWHKSAKRERSEMYEKGLDQVAKEFIDIYNRNFNRRDYFFYYRNWNSDLYTRLCTVDYLFDAIEQLRNFQPGFFLKPDSYNLLGSLVTANFCFVGEVLNPKTKHKIWPFWEYGYSSLYLTQVLDELGFDETEAIWTNYFADDPEQFFIDDILAYTPHLPIICLGGKQAKELAKRSINHYTVFHPSYARRFNVSEYKGQLRAAIDYARQA